MPEAGAMTAVLTAALAGLVTVSHVSGAMEGGRMIGAKRRVLRQVFSGLPYIIPPSAAALCLRGT